MSLVNQMATATANPVAATAQLMPVVIGPMTATTGPVVSGGGGKDSRWLTLEVCREFARSKCSRSDEECKYAHPPPHVEIQNGRVMCCFDSIKGKCQRKDPPCKYLHPPQHLKEILLQNGRQNLINKNLQFQATLQPILSVPPTMVPFVYESGPSGAIKQSAAIMPTATGYSNGVVLPGPTASPSGQYLTMLQQPTAAVGHQYLLQASAAAAAAAASAGYPCYGSTLTGFPPTAYYSAIEGSPASVSLHPGSVITQTANSNRTFNIASLPAHGGCYGIPSSVAVSAAIHTISTDATSANHYQQNLPGTSASSSGSTAAQITIDTASATGVVSSADGINSPGLSTPSADPSASTSMPYCHTPVYYKRPMVEVLTSGVGRKRMLDSSISVGGPASGEDLILGMTALPASMVPVLKRPALIDAKTGLPVYQQFAATPAYQHMAALGTMQPMHPQQFVSVPIANPSQLQRY